VLAIAIYFRSFAYWPPEIETEILGTGDACLAREEANFKGVIVRTTLKPALTSSSYKVSESGARCRGTSSRQLPSVEGFDPARRGAQVPLGAFTPLCCPVLDRDRILQHARELSTPVDTTRLPWSGSAG